MALHSRVQAFSGSNLDEGEAEMTRIVYTLLALLIVLMLSLNACGGGGGSGAVPVAPGQNTGKWDNASWDNSTWGQ